MVHTERERLARTGTIAFADLSVCPPSRRRSRRASSERGWPLYDHSVIMTRICIMHRASCMQSWGAPPSPGFARRCIHCGISSHRERSPRRMCTKHPPRPESARPEHINDISAQLRASRFSATALEPQAMDPACQEGPSASVLQSRCRSIIAVALCIG